MKFVWAREIRDCMNHTVAYRKKMVIQENTVLKITAVALYRVFVNGQLLGYGPARAARGYSRVDEYSLEKFVGKEVYLVIEVFAANINTYYIMNELPFFGAEIVSENQLLADSLDFDAFLLNDRVTKVHRFGFQRAFVESYRMDRCRSNFYLGEDLFPRVEIEEVDGNQLLERQVSYPKYEEIPYQKVVEQGTVTFDWNKPKWGERSIEEIGPEILGYKKEELEECLSDEISAFKFIRGNESQKNTLKEMQYAQYDFDRTLTGFSKLEVDVLADATVYLTFDEIVTEKEGFSEVNPFRSGCCNAQKFKLKAGHYSLLGFEANSMRFANIVVIDGMIRIEKFAVVLYQNPDADFLQFKTGDEELDAIIEASRNTFAQNGVDILTDCPSRERAGWLCDSYFSSRAEYLFTGKNLVEKNFLENYCMAPKSPYLPEGMIAMCYPADHYNGNFIPNWAMWFILELKNYLDRTGDRELIDKAKDKVYGLIKYFEGFLNESGLLEDLEAWVFVEWSKCNDEEHLKGINYPSNMLYSKVLQVVAELYGEEKYALQGQRMKEEIIKQSFNGEFFEDNRVRENKVPVLKGHLTETCQYYAFYFGVATRDKFPKLYHKMMTVFGPSRDVTTTYANVYPSNAIVGNYLRLELLLEDKNYSQVLKECKNFFGKMAKLTGTLWEHNRMSASLNHGFASVAAKYIVECCKNREL